MSGAEPLRVAPGRTSGLARRWVLCAIALIVVALGAAGLCARGSSAPTPPDAVWTIESPADGAPQTGRMPTEVYASPDGTRLDEWRAEWSARYGPVGGPTTLWGVVIEQNFSRLDALIARWREEDVEVEMFDYIRSGRTEQVGATTWHEWTPRGPSNR